MNLPELKQEILDGKLRSLYVFVGEELALQDVYINKLAEIANVNTVVVDSLSDVFNKLNSKSLISHKPSLYIIREDEDYRKKESKWEDLMNLKNSRGNIVVLRYCDIDKRGKFYKAHESVLTEFNFMESGILKNRLQAVTGMSENSCLELVNICGRNYGRIQHELYKLSVFANVNGYSLQTAYLEARKRNMIHEDIGDIIFDFVSAVEERNIPLIYSLYDKLKQTDEGPLKVITILYNSFRNILLVQSTQKQDRTEQVLGLSNAQIYVTSQKCDRYAIQEIVSMVKLLREIEKGIKNGTIDGGYAVDYFLSQIF